MTDSFSDSPLILVDIDAWPVRGWVAEAVTVIVTDWDMGCCLMFHLCLCLPLCEYSHHQRDYGIAFFSLNVIKLESLIVFLCLIWLDQYCGVFFQWKTQVLQMLLKTEVLIVRKVGWNIWIIRLIVWKTYWVSYAWLKDPRGGGVFGWSPFLSLSHYKQF